VRLLLRGEGFRVAIFVMRGWRDGVSLAMAARGFARGLRARLLVDAERSGRARAGIAERERSPRSFRRGENSGRGIVSIADERKGPEARTRN